eukprot:gene27774-31374_t
MKAPSTKTVKAAKAAKPLKVKKGATRSKRWTPNETEILLDVIEEWLPAGPQMWDNACINYNRELKERADEIGTFPQRDLDSMKTRWKILKNAKKPTGDPTCPPDVKRAKRLWKSIEAEWEVVGVSDEEGDVEDDEEEGEEEEDGDVDEDPEVLVAIHESVEDAVGSPEQLNLLAAMGATPGPTTTSTSSASTT